MGDMTKNFRYRANKAVIHERCNKMQIIDQIDQIITVKLRLYI